MVIISACPFVWGCFSWGGAGHLLRGSFCSSRWTHPSLPWAGCLPSWGRLTAVICSCSLSPHHIFWGCLLVWCCVCPWGVSSLHKCVGFFFILFFFFFFFCSFFLPHLILSGVLFEAMMVCCSWQWDIQFPALRCASFLSGAESRGSPGTDWQSHRHWFLCPFSAVNFTDRRDLFLLFCPTAVFCSNFYFILYFFSVCLLGFHANTAARSWSLSSLTAHT